MDLIATAKNVKSISPEWVPIPSVPRAWARPDGSIASLDRYGNFKIRKGSVQHGYRVIRLSGKDWRVNRLIAETFIPNPDNLPLVNHIDEDKLNNQVGNLEWCTHRHNITHGTSRERASEKLSKKVLATDSQGTVVHVFGSIAEAGRNGFNSGNVSRCCRGTRKTHKGLQWKYLTL